MLNMGINTRALNQMKNLQNVNKLFYHNGLMINLPMKIGKKERVHALIKNKNTTKMNYAIIDYKQKNGKIDFNNAILDTPNGQHFLQHLTNKGYYSKKPLYIDIEYNYHNDGGVDCLIISEKTFKYLFDNYTNLNGKIFQTYEQRKRKEKTVGDLAWCDVMKDPYDIG